MLTGIFIANPLPSLQPALPLSLVTGILRRISTGKFLIQQREHSLCIWCTLCFSLKKLYINCRRWHNSVKLDLNQIECLHNMFHYYDGFCLFFIIICLTSSTQATDEKLLLCSCTWKLGLLSWVWHNVMWPLLFCSCNTWRETAFSVNYLDRSTGVQENISEQSLHHSSLTGLNSKCYW